MRVAQDGGGITINFPTVDWSKLVPDLVGFFFNAIGTWLQKSAHETFDGLWSGDHNVLGQTPLDMTWAFGPVAGQVADVQNAARVVLLFAVVLLGIRGMLGGLISRHSDLLGEFVGGVLMAVILTAAFPLLTPLVIGLVNTAAGAVAGSATIGAYVASAGGSDSNPLIGGVLLVILLFFAVRLLIKAVWRIGFLAVLLPVGPLACALYAIPQTRWLLTWWARMWGGMLLAQIPSVFALSIGVGLFVHGGTGIGPFVYSIAFLQLATDLYSVIPFGHVQQSGAPWGGLPMRLGLMAASGLSGGTTAAAAVAIPANQLTTRAEQYGYQ